MNTAIRRTAGIAAISLAALMPHQAAQAASASVQLIWDSFQINVIDTNLSDGITPTLEWIGQTSMVSSVIDGIGWLPIDTVAFNWLDSGYDTYSAPGLELTGVYSNDWLFAEGISDLSTGGVIRAERYGAFTVTGDARIEASVQAEVYASMSSAELASGGYIQADANLFFGDNTGSSLSPVAYLASDPALGVPQSLLLSTSIDLNGGAQTYLYMQPGVFITAVPEPASVGMLLAGLALLAGRFGMRGRG